MGLFSKKKNEEVAIDELTPQIKTKLDELAQKGNQFEEEEVIISCEPKKYTCILNKDTFKYKIHIPDYDHSI